MVKETGAEKRKSQNYGRSQNGIEREYHNGATTHPIIYNVNCLFLSGNVRKWGYHGSVPIQKNVDKQHISTIYPH